MPQAKRVAVIGAGASGLAAIKSCKEEVIEPVCFEKSSSIGGLWNYHDDDLDGLASVMKSTVINTSKEMSAFSDFPPPKEFPNFMHNRLMLRYFEMYSEKFHLFDHIRFHHEIIKVVQSDDYDETGKWVVTTKNTKDQYVSQEIFDGVMVCIGHHVYPHIPTFPGQENFKGKIEHTHSLKVPDAYKDLNVVVIGIGNSGLDAAVDISNVARQVYLSTRRGSWIIFRLGSKGLPFDTQLNRRTVNFLLSIFGWNIGNTYMERSLNEKFDHSAYGLKPNHRFNGQHVAVNDHLPNKILSGTIAVKGDIKTFTENGILFKGEKSVTPVDAVVLATGYKMKFSFLSDEILTAKNNQVDLYKLLFPAHLKHPTLAFIGLIQPLGSIFPISESQSRWFALLMNKKSKLPDKKSMLDDVRAKRKELSERYVDSPRHTVQVDFIPYMDELAVEFGAKPNLFKLALSDPKLFWHCFTGPCLPYQYRLHGPHQWPGARQAILSYEERMMYPLKRRLGVKAENGLTFVYLCTRRGGWIIGRLGTRGQPIDAEFTRRYLHIFLKIFGWRLANAYVEYLLNQKFDHAAYNMKPKHRFNQQHVSMNDHLPSKILTGRIVVKGAIKKFTENGITFKGEKSVTKVDAVVLATGYQIKFPFLDESVITTVNNEVSLYKSVFPPHLKHPSLAFIGAVQPFGCIFPMSESQSRWYVLLLKKELSLPDEATMMEFIRYKKKKLLQRFVKSPRHTIQVDVIPYMDDLATQYGCKPDLMKLAFTDPKLFWFCLMGPSLPYQYRLQGPNAWSGARQAILTYQERMFYPLQTKDAVAVKENWNHKKLFWLFSLLLTVLFLSALQ